MKGGIFLLSLGLYLAVRVPMALAISFQRLEQSLGLPPWQQIPSDLSSLLILIGVGIVVGGAPIFFGVRRIVKARQQQEPIEKQLERKQRKHIAFREENCQGCRFTDADAMECNQQQCTRPEPPEYDEHYCYSRERK